MPVDGVEDARQRLEKGFHLLVAEHQRRGEPHRARYDGVHQESGVLSRLLHLRCERLGEHDTDQQPGTAYLIDERVSDRLDTVTQPLPRPLDVLQQPVRLDGVEDGESPPRTPPGCRRRSCRAGQG